ncbi:hypothetical protein ABPG74_008208 [Tetrahymena malaccensis]
MLQRKQPQSHQQILKEEERKKNQTVPKFQKLKWETSQQYYENFATQSQDHCIGNYQKFFQSQIDGQKKFTFKFHNHELAFIQKLDQIVQCNVCKSDVLRYFWKCSKCSFYACLNCTAQVDTFSEFYDSLTKPQFCYIENNSEKESKFVFIKHLVKPKEVCYNCRYPIKLYSWSDLKFGKHSCLNCTNYFFSVMPVDPLTYKQKMQQINQNEIEFDLEQDQ